MLKFLQLQGLDLAEGSPAPSITRTPEGRAMGSVPGWRCLIDPSYVLNDRALDRVNGEPTTNRDGPPVVSSFPNDEAAFSLSSSELTRIRPQQPINPTAWSAFAVVQVQPASAYQRIMSPLSDVSVPTVRFGFNSNATYFNAWNYPSSEGGEEVIYYMPDEPYVGRTCLMLLTFSTREGMRLFENGEMVQHNENYTEPLQGGHSAGEWVFFWALEGLAGMTGLLDIDLGWPEHAGYRRAIERFLMDKYGIG